MKFLSVTMSHLTVCLLLNRRPGCVLSDLNLHSKFTRIRDKTTLIVLIGSLGNLHTNLDMDTPLTMEKNIRERGYCYNVFITIRKINTNKLPWLDHCRYRNNKPLRK